MIDWEQFDSEKKRRKVSEEKCFCIYLYDAKITHLVECDNRAKNCYDLNVIFINLLRLNGKAKPRETITWLLLFEK